MGEVVNVAFRARHADARVHCAMLRALLDQYDPTDPMSAVRILGVSAQLYSATIGSDEQAAAHLARVGRAMMDIHVEPEPAA